MKKGMIKILWHVQQESKTHKWLEVDVVLVLGTQQKNTGILSLIRVRGETDASELSEEISMKSYTHDWIPLKFGRKSHFVLLLVSNN